MLAAAWGQPVAKRPLAAAMCGSVRSEAVEQQAAAMGPSPGRSQCCALGFMQCSVPQLEGVMIWLCWRQNLRIYMEVSLYREFVRTGCARNWVVWVTSMQAAIAGPPTAHRTTAPGVTSLACCMAARVCWCSRGMWWCVGRRWHSHPALCFGSSEQRRLQVPDQPGKATVPGSCSGSAVGCWLWKRG